MTTTTYDALSNGQKHDEDTPATMTPSTRAPSPGGKPALARGASAVDQLLRDRDAVLARIRDDIGLIDLARVMLVTIAVASAIFGAALGTYRGGIQILYAAIKFPMLMLATAAICAPSLSAFNAALERPSSLRKDLALVLTSLALGSLLLVAQAPLILLASSLAFEYHSLILITFGACAVAGLASLSMVTRGLRASYDGRHKSAVLSLLLIFCVVGAQMAWTLRPYVVRPRTPEVPFVRAVEGSLLEALTESLQSARGIYTREYAPLPGEDVDMDTDMDTHEIRGTGAPMDFDERGYDVEFQLRGGRDDRGGFR